MASRPIIAGPRSADYAIGLMLDFIQHKLGPFEQVLTTDDVGIAVLAARWAFTRGLILTTVPVPLENVGRDRFEARAQRLFDLEPDLVLVFDAGREVDLLCEMAHARVLPVWRCVVDRSTQWTPRLEWRPDN